MSQSSADKIPTIDFNPNAPGFDSNPFDAFTRMREDAPVHYWPAANGYVVARFRDVSQMLRDSRLTADPVSVGRPSFEDALPEELRRTFARSLFRLDPKDHARVRRAVSPAFTPRAIERMRPIVRRVVAEALAPFEGKGEIDVVPFAEFIPLRVIGSMLAIPPEHEAVFRNYGTASISAIVDPRLTAEERARVLAPVVPGLTLLRELIAHRRKHLGDDLLSTLIRAEEQGDRLSEDEMVALVQTIIGAGSETTVHFICFAVKSLLCVPERASAVRADPSLLRGALEETLRFDSFGKSGITRYATEDVELGGVRIEKGSMLLGFLPAALRDPRAFKDADQFDPHRELVENLNFGQGMHYCLGPTLARLEGEVAIRALLDRYDDMRLAAPPTYGFNLILRKIESLRVVVTPRSVAERPAASGET